MEQIKSELQQAGKYLMEYGLAWGNSGNISARTSHDSYLITASGTYLGELADNDLIECDLSGNSYGLPGQKPSKEIPMHRTVYENRPEIGAVFHAAPFYSTIVACSDIEIPSNLFVESMYYLENIERVPYFHPGSKELGEAVREKVKSANILFLENHGVLVYDVSVKEARMALQTLEMTCRMIIESKSSNVHINGIPNKVETEFLEKSGYKPRRKWD